MCSALARRRLRVRVPSSPPVRTSRLVPHICTPGPRPLALPTSPSPGEGVHLVGLSPRWSSGTDPAFSRRRHRFDPGTGYRASRRAGVTGPPAVRHPAQRPDLQREGGRAPPPSGVSPSSRRGRSAPRPRRSRWSGHPPVERGITGSSPVRGAWSPRRTTYARGDRWTSGPSLAPPGGGGAAQAAAAPGSGGHTPARRGGARGHRCRTSAPPGRPAPVGPL